MSGVALQFPTEAEVASALAQFGQDVRRAYGARLQGLYLFGSRARGDHRPDSDADVAVILEDGDWRFWDEKMRLIDLAFDYRIDNGVYIQSWPFAASHWGDPAQSSQPRLIASAKRDAIEIGPPV
jgi:uncharacterized protein